MPTLRSLLLYPSYAGWNRLVSHRALRQLHNLTPRKDVNGLTPVQALDTASLETHPPPITTLALVVPGMHDSDTAFRTEVAMHLVSAIRDAFVDGELVLHVGRQGEDLVGGEPCRGSEGRGRLFAAVCAVTVRYAGHGGGGRGGEGDPPALAADGEAGICVCGRSHCEKGSAFDRGKEIAMKVTVTRLCRYWIEGCS